MYKDPLTYFWKEFSQHFYMVILHSNILCVRLMIERMNVELTGIITAGNENTVYNCLLFILPVFLIQSLSP